MTSSEKIVELTLAILQLSGYDIADFTVVVSDGVVSIRRISNGREMKYCMRWTFL